LKVSDPEPPTKLSVLVVSLVVVPATVLPAEVFAVTMLDTAVSISVAVCAVVVIPAR
jgi:hypothetical protein